MFMTFINNRFYDNADNSWNLIYHFDVLYNLYFGLYLIGTTFYFFIHLKLPTYKLRNTQTIKKVIILVPIVCMYLYM